MRVLLVFLQEHSFRDTGDVPAGTLWNFSVENASMYLLLQ